MTVLSHGHVKTAYPSAHHSTALPASRFRAAFRILDQRMSTDEAPVPVFSAADRRFLRQIGRTLIAATLRDAVDIDIVTNLERMVGRANHGHRTNVRRLVRWSRRLAFLYGGAQMPARAAKSRFLAIQRLARALSSLCLVAFWADDAALVLMERPGPPS